MLLDMLAAVARKEKPIFTQLHQAEFDQLWNVVLVD
jgi:hypothetical protein